MITGVVGDVPGVAAARGVGGGLDLKVVGGAGKHALLTVKDVLGQHADEAGMLQVLIVIGGLAHRLQPRRLQRCLMADSLTNPKLLGDGMSPTALTWAFASWVAKSSDRKITSRKWARGSGPEPGAV